MRFRVEPSPAGGWYVKLEGHDAPVSRHDTEDEALARAEAYARGAAPEGECVTLRDGSVVLIRPIAPEDKPLFREAWKDFGETSRLRRFLGIKQELTVEDLAFFTEVDQAEHAALAAIDPATGHLLATARYVRHPGRPEAAEAAVSVIDSWQGRGLGGALLERLTARACQNGVTRFTAELRADNRAMLRLFEHLGRTDVRRDAGDLELDVDLRTDSPEELESVLRGAAAGDVAAR